ncbi:RNA polymerase subunit sigma-70 [Rhodococcus phenolicus]|uniref:RNA polymerase subunit sigma-70 n=1 Tax=Rhodococcus phenolicus TaxID=263849 RepID=UPI000833150C|nr:RNA polymerase subunit sigma-70 [Rhodococcus phenolicus]
MTMAYPPRQFGSTEHLASEAVAAYVDGELRMNAYLRASQHLSVCPECAAEVEAQQQARLALRNAARRAPQMPSSLLGALSNIPTHLQDTTGQTPHPLLSGQDPMWSVGRRWSIRRRR